MSTTLYDAAVRVLKANGADVDKAVPVFMKLLKGSLLKHIAADYLRRVAADIRQGMDSISRGKEGPHRRERPPSSDESKMPTAMQKAVALRAAVAEARSILDTQKLRDGRAIGDVPLYELPQLAANGASKATSFLSRGFEDAVDAIACHKLSMHVQPSSQDARVRDIIKSAEVERIYAEARLMAAQRIADAASRTARDLLAATERPELLQ